MPSFQDPSRAGDPSDWPAPAAPHEWAKALQTPLRFLKGVGPKRAAQLEALGLATVEDLLYHLPFRYEDRRRIKKIGEAADGRDESFIGRLDVVEKKYVPARRKQIALGRLADETGALELVWYHAPPYLLRGLVKGQRLLVHGKVETAWGGRKRIVHPRFEAIGPEDGEDREKILPVYIRPGGIPLSAMRRWVGLALEEYGRFLPGCLPEPVIKRQRLMDLRSALRALHKPAKSADIGSLNRLASPPHRSVVFDEFFYLQLGLGLKRAQRAAQGGISFAAKGELARRMGGLLPFSLTRAQRRVLQEIWRDMESPRPMQRLVQGDVGSGKTMIGWLAALKAIESGFQAVWMAPTELLAEQHFRGLAPFAGELGVSSILLTGSLSERAKRESLQRIEEGEIDFIVGTHAVIQEGVRVPRLGLGIIDEQHRFGVAQRLALQRLGAFRISSPPSAFQPDIVLMSATPIPRSLAMVLYGDMEISVVDEMPPGRIPVATRIVDEKDRARLYDRIRQELDRGHQAYVVYPLVEASERLQLRDATGMAEELSRGPFRGSRLGLIHGRMSAAERDDAMRRFQAGELQILVATTVIEVGIDVPNATVMVVEHAERFGLSQLHQLRGRVGRGKDRSFCYLVHYGGEEGDASTRLRIMEREHDGFKVAEADLALRGPGEFLGTRQSGRADFRLASLVRDSRLLFEARKEALDWLAFDPGLQRPASAPLKRVLDYRWGGRLGLGAVG